MPPADWTTGLACSSRSFSALGDQRAEILPVQRPPARAVGGRCMMRLTRLLMFPIYFLSASWISSPTPRCLPKCPENLLGNLGRIRAFNRPVNLVEIFERPKILPRRPSGLLPQQIQNSTAVGLELQDAAAKTALKNTGRGFKPGSMSPRSANLAPISRWLGRGSA